MDRRVYLKIKIKSLAAEAKIIRREEKRSKDLDLKNGLAYHRKTVVRPEARATQIAYGFLRGRAYSQIEFKADHQPDWKKVKSMVERYGGDTKTFDEWVKGTQPRLVA